MSRSAYKFQGRGQIGPLTNNNVVISGADIRHLHIHLALPDIEALSKRVICGNNLHGEQTRQYQHRHTDIKMLVRAIFDMPQEYPALGVRDVLGLVSRIPAKVSAHNGRCDCLTNQVTVTVEPATQTVVAVGLVIFGLQISRGTKPVVLFPNAMGSTCRAMRKPSGL